MKAIITADNHLNKYYSKMSPDQLEERRRNMIKNFGEIADYGIDNDVDLFLHCGDLFDMPNPRNPPVSYVGEKVVELEKNGVKTFFVVGNHDMPKMKTDSGGSSPQHIFESFNVGTTFLDNDRINSERVSVDGLDVNVSGLSFNPLLGDGVDPLKGKDLDLGNGSDFSIFLTHYGVEDHLMGRGDEPVVSHSSVDELGVDVFCSGHIHQPNDFRVGDTQVVVPGATERMNFGEIDRDTGFYVVNYDQDLSLEYRKLEPQPMMEKHFSVNSLISDDQDLRTNGGVSTSSGSKEDVSIELDSDPNEEILSVIRGESDPDKLFKLVLEGDIPRKIYHKLDLTSYWRVGKKKNFYFDLVDNIVFESSERTFEGERLSQIDELRRVGQKIKEESGKENKELVNDAIQRIITDYRGDEN